MKTTMTSIQAIKTFFEADGGKRVTMDELKKVPKDDRAELAELAAVELGVELSKPTK